MSIKIAASDSTYICRTFSGFDPLDVKSRRCVPRSQVGPPCDGVDVPQVGPTDKMSYSTSNFLSPKNPDKADPTERERERGEWRAGR